ncbi:hypothetical protein [Propionigenium maris]|uniref:hypothetical protein n=1 Tax=Propionigenium maris TaxID=45622 RepID=UPI00248FF883|nr:hypothetical protein [Propionigenium maris]
MVLMLLLSIPIVFIGVKLQCKKKSVEPDTIGSKGIAKERLLKDKLLKGEYLVAISKKRYHRVGCRYAESDGDLYSVATAKKRRLVACKVCRP